MGSGPFCFVLVFRARDLARQAAPPLLPHRPQAEVLHLLVEPGLLHQGFDLGARLPLAQALRALGDAEEGDRGQRCVQLEFADIHFVERVGEGVIVGDVIRFFLDFKLREASRSLQDGLSDLHLDAQWIRTQSFKKVEVLCDACGLQSNL